MAFVVVPSAQIDGIAFAAAFGHSHDVDEKSETLFGLGRRKAPDGQDGPDPLCVRYACYEKCYEKSGCAAPDKTRTNNGINAL